MRTNGLKKHDLRKIAAARMDLHKNHKTTRRLSRDYEYIGLLGEWIFATEFNYEIDLSIKPGGDSAIDFITPLGAIDIKTYRKALNLLREIDKKHAHILVLGQYLESKDDVLLVGWEFDSIMISCPKKDFGYGIINHYKHKEKLRPMWVLKHLLNFCKSKKIT